MFPAVHPRRRGARIATRSARLPVFVLALGWAAPGLAQTAQHCPAAHRRPRGRCRSISNRRQAARCRPQQHPAEPRRHGIQFSREKIETQPQGDNAPLNQVILQAPGVAQDSFGQLHVRGDHANLQFRINGVQLPEGINVFGQSLQTRLANSVS